VTQLEPGAVFGRDFRVVRPLRAGGMGSVYVVEQLSTGAQRALKVMAPELASDQTTRERFIREARVGALIDSDHVVEVVTAGVDEQSGAPYLVMELLRGEELADVVARLGPLPLGDVAEIMDQAGHGLEQAHAKGIVHRDLKPENVFLGVARRRDATFTVKILDFGIAKLVADQQAQQRGTQALGTPLYMPPEQTENAGRITPASDVWSLGLIAFYLLVGREFWRGASGTLPLLLREIVVDPIPYATARAAELGNAAVLPPGFDAWFARCVNRDIEARFPEAGAAMRAFAELVPPEAPAGAVARALSSGDTARLPTGSAATVLAPTTGAPLTTAAATAPPTRSASTSAGTANAALPAVPAPSSKGPGLLIAGGVAVLAAAGAGIFFFTQRGAPQPEAPTPAASSPSSAAVAPAPSASTGAAPTAACPEGMALIRGGNMFMGEQALANAQPPHRVTVSPFCLDIYEVSVEAYEKCVGEGNCLKALQDVDFPGIKRGQREKFRDLCNTRRPGKEKHPINCVDWSMADNFCRGAGGRLQKGGARLPTEAEWEFAARGSSQRTYPWGDEPPDATRLNACGKECATWMSAHLETTGTMYDGDDGYPATAPVDSFPAGKSADGIVNMAGNVMEWTADWYGPYSEAPAVDPKGAPEGKERVARGGAYNGDFPDWPKPAFRWKTVPAAYNHAIGFRCAFTPPK
jgi:eukaryotic-like serine/threonine-protein kinase